jgi:hypothetical protein
MLKRTDFTTPEWQELQTAILGTIRYITLASPNFFGDIKEQIIAKKAIENFATSSNSNFINELADFNDFKSYSLPNINKLSADELETPVLMAIAKSKEAIAKRDDDSAVMFVNLIKKIAHDVASAHEKMSNAEQNAYTKVILATKEKPYSEAKKWDPNNPLGHS